MNPYKLLHSKMSITCPFRVSIETKQKNYLFPEDILREIGARDLHPKPHTMQIVCTFEREPSKLKEFS